MEEKNEQSKNENKIKTIRTFSSDMAEAVRQNEISVIKIAMAEKDRREQEIEQKKNGNSKFAKVLFFIGGILLIGVTAFGAYYFLNLKKQKEVLVVKEKPRIETFINYDNAIMIDTDKINNLMSLTSSIHSKIKDEKPGINAIFFTNKGDEDEDVFMNKDQMLSLIKSTAPESLTRSMTNKFLFGKYKDGNSMTTSSAFLIFEISDYNLAYASMLDWEKSIFNDLFILFDISISDSDSSLFEKDWKDVIVNNKDARVLYGEDGEGILYYSFVNKNTLVITEKADSLKSIITSILIKNPQ